MFESTTSPLSFDGDESGEEYVDIQLRPAREAAGRLLVLVALARRGYLEQDAGALSAEARADERFDVLGWLADERLLDLATSAERAALETPIGRLAPEDALALTWRLEGAAVLAWALGLVPAWPAITVSAPADTLLDTLPPTWSRVTEFRDEAALVPESEIAAAREEAEVWATRAELARAPGDAEAVALIAEIAAESLAAGVVASLAAGDLAVTGQPYAALSLDNIDELGTIANERLVALDWLCGLADLESPA